MKKNMSTSPPFPEAFQLVVAGRYEAWAGWLLITILGMFGCVQGRMMQVTDTVRSAASQQDYAHALTALQQSRSDAYREQDRVAYWMDEGMLLHLLGRYSESNASLEKAEQRVKQLYTHSIAKRLTATFTSDAATDYVGESYEHSLLNVMKALNYLQLGQLGEALVEARRLQAKQPQKDQRELPEKPAFRGGFEEWFMGLLFEMERSYDDASIAYKKALRAYERDFAAGVGPSTPPFVVEDLIRTALLAGDGDEAQRYRQQYGAQLGGSATELQKSGEVILIHLSGYGPRKSDYYVSCAVWGVAQWKCDAAPDGAYFRQVNLAQLPTARGSEQPVWIKLAFPQLQTVPVAGPVHTTFIAANGQRTSATSQAVLSINQLAAQTAAMQLPAVFRNTVVRAVAKTLASKGAGELGKALAGNDRRAGALLGLVTQLGTSLALEATEEADKRCWSSLPAQIEVTRVLLPPGTYTLQAEQSGHARPRIQVRPGVRIILSDRAF